MRCGGSAPPRRTTARLEASPRPWAPTSSPSTSRRLLSPLEPAARRSSTLPPEKGTEDDVEKVVQFREPIAIAETEGEASAEPPEAGLGDHQPGKGGYRPARSCSRSER